MIEFPLNPIKISPTPKIAPCLTCKTLLKHFSINFVRISLTIKSGLKMQSTESDYELNISMEITVLLMVWNYPIKQETFRYALVRFERVK